MFKKILLPVILAILAYGFLVSPNFNEIAAGVAIFLFGMLSLEEGFRSFTGGLLERLLNRTTDRFWKSISFGIVTTTIMQSSSLVSVITISFLSAELIGLLAGVGIIFGANIGTTTGAWLVAGFGLKVKISAYAMPMLVFGIILVFQKAKTLKGVGYVLSGLGFLFLGIHHMKEGFEAFRETIDLAEFAIPGYSGLLVFTLIGVAATVIMQSSHATLVLIITALAAKQITYENALALAIGANVGTTITAIIGAASANFQGKRLAGAHLIFNLVTGAIAIAFIHQIRWLVDETSDAVGIPANDYTLKLAVFHTIFNVIGVVVMTPLVRRLVAFLERVIRAPEGDVVVPKYINAAVQDFPETMLQAARNEALHLFDNAFDVMARGLGFEPDIIKSDRSLFEEARKAERLEDVDVEAEYTAKVKGLHAAILDFISQTQTKIPPDVANKLYTVRQACADIVRAVKAVKHLRKNVERYTASENAHIRKLYDTLRAQVAMILRRLGSLREADEKTWDVLELDEIKLAVEQENIVVDGTMDRLIREGKITASMGSSLTNDHMYVKECAWILADVGKALFGAREEADQEAQDLLLLTEDEIDGLIETGRVTKLSLRPRQTEVEAKP